MAGDLTTLRARGLAHVVARASPRTPRLTHFASPMAPHRAEPPNRYFEQAVAPQMVRTPGYGHDVMHTPEGMPNDPRSSDVHPRFIWQRPGRRSTCLKSHMFM